MSKRRPRSAVSARGERGTVALLTVMGGSLVAAVALLVIGCVTDVVVAHARASAAADAAALAAAGASPVAGGDGDPRTAARRLAAENHATLAQLRDEHWPLRVTVRVAVPTRVPLVRAVVPEATANATAELRPLP